MHRKGGHKVWGALIRQTVTVANRVQQTILRVTQIMRIKLEIACSRRGHQRVELLLV
jgi:hypothetical protein